MWKNGKEKLRFLVFIFDAIAEIIKDGKEYDQDKRRISFTPNHPSVPLTYSEKNLMKKSENTSLW